MATRSTLALLVSGAIGSVPASAMARDSPTPAAPTTSASSEEAPGPGEEPPPTNGPDAGRHYPEAPVQPGDQPYRYPRWADPRNIEASPETLPFDANQPAPKGYVRSTQSQPGWIISGATIFGVSHGIGLTGAAIISSVGGDSTVGGLIAIPVFGPIGLGLFYDDFKGELGGQVALVSWGLLQGFGLTAWIYGSLAKDEIWLRNDLADITFGPLDASASSVASRPPQPLPAPASFGMLGRF